MRVNTPMNSEEWYERRRNVVTSSVAAAILGSDPRRGPYWAYMQVMGRHARSPAPPDGKLRVDPEGVIRRDYEQVTSLPVFEGGFFISDRNPWLGGSPHYLVGEEGILEVSCPAELPPGIPAHHEVRAAVKLLATDRQWCDYFCWRPGEGFITRVHRDEARDAEILRGLVDFYNRYVLTETPPPRRRQPKEPEDD